MFRSYIKIAIRNLLKQWSYTVINVFGLMVGIAAFLLIALFIQYHLSFDNHIPEADQLFRVVQVQQAQGVGEQHVAVNMSPLSEAALSDIPEVIDAVRVMSWGSQNFRVGDQYYSQPNVAWTDPSVFRLFGIRLLAGDTASALREIRSVVLSETIALKFYGSIDDAMGQLIEFNNEEGYMITGVMEDQPRNSHMWMDVLVSYETALNSFPWLDSWGSNSMSVYVKLQQGVDYKLVSDKMTTMLDNYFDPETYFRPQVMYLQPVPKVHLFSNHIKFQVNFQMGNSRIVLVFIVVAMLIIIIACINFINLAIARSVKRAKEVGMRKVLGANRQNLIYQFLGESMLITLAAILLSLVLVELALPEFNRMLETELSVHLLRNPLFNIGVLVIWIVVSLLSGVYPAFFMSRYKAIEVLKGVGGQQARAKGWLGKTLVVFQFSIAIVLIFVVLVTNRQMDYVLNKNLGYNYENVLGVYLQGGHASQKAELLRPKIRQLPGVEAVAAASFINGVAGNQSTITVDDTAQERVMVRFGYVDEDFFPLMDIQFVAGRNFSRDYPNDINESIILNQAAVNYLGWDDPIGKRFLPTMDTINNRTVVGVISDYHYYSVHSRIEPAAYIIRPQEYGVLCVRYSGDSKDGVIERLEEEWFALFPSTPFNTVVASERLERQYAGDRNTLKVFMMFTLLSILISALGLYGLTALHVEQRTREIGIRKVLGGSVQQLMMLIFKEFLLLVVVAGFIAIPLGYYFSKLFLDQFAYAINIQWYYAFFSLLSAILIAASTIIFHAQRAAVINPVESLKYE